MDFDQKLGKENSFDMTYGWAKLADVARERQKPVKKEPDREMSKIEKAQTKNYEEKELWNRGFGRCWCIAGPTTWTVA